MIALAKAGVGLAYSADLIAAPALSEGTLGTVLNAYSQRSQGLYLYFPAKSQTQPKLRAFIDFATKARRRGTPASAQ